MSHNDNHEGFDTFLQFPDFFFNEYRLLNQRIDLLCIH